MQPVQLMGAPLSRVYVLSAALLFSTGGAAIKLASLTSWQIACFRSALAAALLWAAIPAWRRFWEPGALAVGVAYGATLVLYVTANTLTTASNAIFLQTSAPLYLLLLGPWLLREPVRRLDVVAVGLIGIGLGLFFVGVEAPQRTAPDPAGGNLLGAASGVTWAFALLGLRWLARKARASASDPAGAAVVAGNVLACAACLPFALAGFRVADVGALDAAVVAYLGIFQIGLAYVFMVRGVRGVRALELSLLLATEPVLNAVWAWSVHAELPAPVSAVGAALIAAGVLVQALRAGTR